MFNRYLLMVSLLASLQLSLTALEKQALQQSSAALVGASAYQPYMSENKCKEVYNKFFTANRGITANEIYGAIISKIGAFFDPYFSGKLPSQIAHEQREAWLTITGCAHRYITQALSGKPVTKQYTPLNNIPKIYTSYMTALDNANKRILQLAQLPSNQLGKKEYEEIMGLQKQVHNIDAFTMRTIVAVIPTPKDWITTVESKYKDYKQVIPDNTLNFYEKTYAALYAVDDKVLNANQKFNKFLKIINVNPESAISVANFLSTLEKYIYMADKALKNWSVFNFSSKSALQKKLNMANTILSQGLNFDPRARTDLILAKFALTKDIASSILLAEASVLDVALDKLLKRIPEHIKK